MRAARRRRLFPSLRYFKFPATTRLCIRTGGEPAGAAVETKIETT